MGYIVGFEILIICLGMGLSNFYFGYYDVFSKLELSQRILDVASVGLALQKFLFSTMHIL